MPIGIEEAVIVEREEETGEVSLKVQRQYSGAMAMLVKAVSIILPLYCLIYILEIPGTYFGVLFYPVSFRALFLFLALTLIFLLYPATAKSPKDRLPWYDLAFIALALAPTLYLSFLTPAIVKGVKTGVTVIDQVLFIVTLLLLGEATRRTIGKEMLWVLFLFLAYIPLAQFLPGLWGAKAFTLGQITEYIYLFDSGIFGFILGIPATLIIVFVIFGAVMVQAGTATLLMNCSLALAGRFRGGPAKVAILVSAAFGTMSGSSVANVGAVGVITIPLMKKLGYKDWFAGAVESVASTGGVIMPPVMGSIAFIMSEFTGVGYGSIALAAAIPAVLYYLALYFQLDFEAAKMNLQGLPREELPSLRGTLEEGAHLLLPIFLLVFLLMVLRMNAIEAVLISTIATIALSWVRRKTRIGVGKFLNALSSAGKGILYVTPACAGAGIMNGAISLTGLGVNLAELVRRAAGDSLLLLALYTWMAIYLSGLAVGEIIIYIVMAIIIVPAFVALKVPILAAHMFIFYMSVASFITPPNCPPVFVACSIAGSGMWKTGLQAMKLGIVTFLVPFVLLFNPAMILIGTPVQILLVSITSLIGVLCLAAGLEGYLLVPAAWWQRLLFLAGGVGLFTPSGKLNLLGVALAMIPGIAQLRNWRSNRSLHQEKPALKGKSS